MELAAKIGTMARRGKPLPYDAELPWIESTAKQVIDTGYTVAADTVVEFEADLLVSEYPSFFNYWISADISTSDTSASFAFQIAYRAGLSYWARSFMYGTITTIPSPPPPSGFSYVRVSKDMVTINGVDYQLNESTFKGGAATLAIFGRHTLDSYDLNNSRMRLKWLRIVGAHDFIPVMVSGVGCLYDKRGFGGMNADGSARDDGLYFDRRGIEPFIIPQAAYGAFSTGRGGSTKCLTQRRSYRRSSRPSARFYAHSQEWEVAA